ncbi:hypothetical protein KC19_VG080900 [Ceratodon purpureus]|uniref:Uncharacterized protein n=1 Tax=Ceratodon purpureus TaxID=3225 RepID=A0A8T0HNP5_CERPU|nr:hypothetical protein KC19_VG080900 [Ceratodon purpureus]
MCQNFICNHRLRFCSRFPLHQQSTVSYNTMPPLPCLAFFISAIFFQHINNDHDNLIASLLLTHSLSHYSSIFFSRKINNSIFTIY